MAGEEPKSQVDAIMDTVKSMHEKDPNKVYMIAAALLVTFLLIKRLLFG